MSYDDKKFGTLFPTRHGTPTGTANERQMLDRIGGSESFRKTYRTNVDGSVTRCDTNNGMPRFITERVEDPTKLAAYMESGQLEFSWPGDENPTRLFPAKWRFLDISTGEDYLGKIGIASTNIGLQDNTPALSEGQDSLAIGYPKGTTSASEEAYREAYGEATLLKKITASYFPPSLYSGKMRLFLQALYGAKETTHGFSLMPDVVGSSVVLRYSGSSGGESVQFGLWAHHSPGVFTAPDGTWWLLTITGGPTFIVTGYRLIHNSTGKVLHNLYMTAGITGEYRRRLEAYIFAHSYFDTTSPVSLGSYNGAAGAPLGYGWKWNTDGSKASIIVHEILGTGAADVRWMARTMHFTFSYQGSQPNPSLSVTEHGEWTDGWGGYNIFAPEVDIQTRLACVSLAMSRNTVKPAFDFNDIPVYGYYKNDTWSSVTMSRSVFSWAIGNEAKEEDHVGLVFNAGVDSTAYGSWEDGFFIPSAGYTVRQRVITERTNMSIAFDGFSYSGVSKSGAFTNIKFSIGEIGPDRFSDINQKLPSAPSQAGGGVGCEATTESYESYVAAAAVPGAFGDWHSSYCKASSTREVEAYTAIEARVWALVIPGGDAEAVYIAEAEYTSNYLNYRRDTYFIPEYSGATNYSYIALYTAHRNDGGVMYIEPYTATINQYQSGPDNTSTTSYTPPAPWANSVKCFNAAIGAADGTPAHSYVALFQVDYNYPFYDPGMYVYTSADKRYVFSEGLKSPASVNYLNRFVGWA